jgi:tRNA-2-methylthio-N6-dimethylallyladenosine synthase
MNRGYSREWYLDRIAAIRRIIPNCAITTDIITGFCDETEDEHKDTITILKEVKWDFAYMYKYSERPKTLAERRFEDNIEEEVKSTRLREIIDLQRKNSAKKNLEQVGKVHKVLIEGTSKRSDLHMSGRNDHNTKVVFPMGNSKKGDYILVKITDCTTATLLGEIIEIIDPQNK